MKDHKRKGRFVVQINVLNSKELRLMGLVNSAQSIREIRKMEKNADPMLVIQPKNYCRMENVRIVLHIQELMKIRYPVVHMNVLPTKEYQ